MSEKELRKAFMNEERTVNTMINLLSEEEKQKIRKEASEAAWEEFSKAASKAAWDRYSRLISWLCDNGRIDDLKIAAKSDEEYDRLYSKMEESNL